MEFQKRFRLIQSLIYKKSSQNHSKTNKMLQQDQFPFNQNSNQDSGSSVLGTLLLIGGVILSIILVNKMAISDSTLSQKSND